MGAGNERKYYVFAIRAFSDITATILVPVAVVLALKYVAHINGTWFYVLLVASFIFSAIALWRKVKVYAAAYDKLLTSDRSSSAGS